MTWAWGHKAERRHNEAPRKYLRGEPPPKPQNVFWRVRPLYSRLPLLGECSRYPSVSVNQLALWWEAAFGFSKFFWRLFNTIAHFMMGDLWAYLPTPHWVLGSFWPKWHDTCAPPYPFMQSHPKWLFFVSPDKKSPQRKCFANMEEVKPKLAQALKGIKIDKFENCFEQRRKMSW